MEKINLKNPLSLISLLIIVGFIGACYYTFPSYDDFSYSGSVLDLGFWASQINHYFAWGGRFSSNFIIAVICHIDSQWHLYGYWAFLLLGLFFSTQFYLIRKLKSFASFNELQVWVITSALILAALPSIVQFTYWITGAVYYSLGIFATALGIGLLISREKTNHPLKNAVLTLLTVIIVGNNELSLIGWQELLLSFVILKFFKTQKWDKFLIFVLILGTVLGLFSLLAPGNFVRQAEFEKSGQLFRTVSNGILHFFLFSIKLLSPALIVVIVRYRKELINFAEKLLTGVPQDKAKKIIFAHWFLFLFSTSALAFWAMGRKPNTRSLNVIMYYYWLMIPFILWFFKDLKVPAVVQNFARKVEELWIPLTVISLLLSFNVRNLIKDYAFYFSTYRQEWSANMKTLHNGQGQDVVLISPTVKAATTYFSDLIPKRDDLHFRKIYGVKSIRIEKKGHENEKI